MQLFTENRLYQKLTLPNYQSISFFFNGTSKSKNIHLRQCRIQNRDGHMEEEEKEQEEHMMALEDYISVPACTGSNIFEIIESAYGF